MVRLLINDRLCNLGIMGVESRDGRRSRTVLGSRIRGKVDGTTRVLPGRDDTDRRRFPMKRFALVLTMFLVTSAAFPAWADTWISVGPGRENAGPTVEIELSAEAVRVDLQLAGLWAGDVTIEGQRFHVGAHSRARHEGRGGSALPALPHRAGTDSVRPGDRRDVGGGHCAGYSPLGGRRAAGTTTADRLRRRPQRRAVPRPGGLRG